MNFRGEYTPGTRAIIRRDESGRIVDVREPPPGEPNERTDTEMPQGWSRLGFLEGDA